MNNTIGQYFQLKQLQKEIEQQLARLREDILKHCEQHHITTLDVGEYKVKVITQDRREYDFQKISAVLPDPDVWKMFAKVDTAKLASLIKLAVIPEHRIEGTYAVKTVKQLQVTKD